jgi:peptidoglycan/LPS O-acetylase OafA/YrhL
VATRTEKDIPLEALRGLAAVVVVFFHCILAFYPQWIEQPGFDPSLSMKGQWWFVLVNGPGAVNLFSFFQPSC